MPISPTPEENASALAVWAVHLPTKGARKIIALAGPPASGKTTLATALVEYLNATGTAAALLAMDGFHLDNPVLEGRGLRARKGAPETFDLDGLRSILERLAAGDEVYAPRFDRALELSIGSAVPISKNTEIIVAEGNYLLLDDPGWRELGALWDGTVMVDVPPATLRARLTERWTFHGLSAEDMRVKIDENDLPNAERIRAHSRPADLDIEN